MFIIFKDFIAKLKTLFKEAPISQPLSKTEQMALFPILIDNPDFSKIFVDGKAYGSPSVFSKSELNGQSLLLMSDEAVQNFALVRRKFNEEGEVSYDAAIVDASELLSLEDDVADYSEVKTAAFFLDRFFGTNLFGTV